MICIKGHWTRKNLIVWNDDLVFLSSQGLKGIVRIFISDSAKVFESEMTLADSEILFYVKNSELSL